MKNFYNIIHNYKLFNLNPKNTKNLIFKIKNLKKALMKFFLKKHGNINN